MNKERFKSQNVEQATSNLNIRIRPSVKKLLKDGSTKVGVSMAEYVETLILEEFKKDGK